MSIFEQALENLRTAFAPQQSADNAPPFNPFEMNAYGIGNGSPENEKAPDKEDFLKSKTEAQESAVSSNIHRFDNGTSVETYFDKNGDALTFVQGKNGAYVTSAKSDEHHRVSFNSDGSYTMQDRQNNSTMQVSKHASGFTYDCSNFSPTGGISKGCYTKSGGKVNFAIDESGKVNVRSVEGNVRENEVFFKGKDGGIRTVTPDGQLVLADSKAVSKNFSSKELASHKALLKEAEKNPEIAARQGVAPQAKDPQKAASPQAQEQQSLQAQQPMNSIELLKAEAKQAAAHQMKELIGKSAISAPAQQSATQSPQHAPASPNAQQKPAGRQL